MNPPKSCMGSQLTGKSQEEQGNRGRSTEALAHSSWECARNGRTRAPPEKTRGNQGACVLNGTTLISFPELFSFFNVDDRQWRRKWQPTPIVLSGEIHGQRSLAGYSPWGHKESDTTERLTQYMTNKHSRHKFFNLHFILRKTLDLHWELN